MKGRWSSEFFGNNNPVILELGCGKGEYTLNLAGMFPEYNFIGIDRKGSRMWRGAKTAKENNIINVAFLRTRIELICSFFAAGEVQEIWITFPDPHPSKSGARHRLTSLRFLDLYRQFLIPGGVINLKTDSPELYKYTNDLLQKKGCEILFSTTDLYGTAVNDPVLSIKTFYEKMHLAENKKICYLKFILNESY